MSTRTEVRSRVLAAALSPDVAVAAGVAPATWSNADALHAFDGNVRNLGGRNRGRLPFVEFFLESQPFDPEGTDIGGVMTTVRIRAHVGGSDRVAAQETGEAMILAMFALLRSDDYFSGGDQSIDGYTSQPIWHTVNATFVVQHTYNPDTFEA